MPLLPPEFAQDAVCIGVARGKDGEFVACIRMRNFLHPLLAKEAPHFENAQLAILVPLQETEGLPKAHLVGTQGTFVISGTCIGLRFAIQACVSEAVGIDVSLTGTRGSSGTHLS
jgi:hypothetical protein